MDDWDWDHRRLDDMEDERTRRLYGYDAPPGYDAHGREPCRICGLPIEFSVALRRYVHATPRVSNDVAGMIDLAHFTLTTSTHSASER